MKLPGGIKIDGALKRNFRFKPVTGSLEMVLCECAGEAGNAPARITAVLCEALAELGDTAVSAYRVRNLCVGDRQFLMGQLATQIDEQPVWLTAECGQCRELFDVSMRFGKLPVKPAGDHYPETSVDTIHGRLQVRVPSGADQEAIAEIDDETEALIILLQRIVSTADPSGVFDVTRLSEAEIADIEARVEAMAPEIATHLNTRCPSCETENQLPIHSYTLLQRPVGDLYAEIHRLATAYHWSEKDILGLPRARRKFYLQMIDEQRGMINQPSVFEVS